ncbi:threonine aspartase 1 isoform X5 [Cetorhinus maximus]
MEAAGSLGPGDPQPPGTAEGTAPMERSGREAASEEKSVGFVLVHAGAGYHSESKAKEYKQVCKKACQKAIEKLQAGALAVDVVTAALIELEDSPFTNAGMGSNLNLSGDIECDASTMDGKSLNFGAVGALRGIKNPILVANKLLSEAQKGKLSAGRIPPCFLVGEGAYKWAVDHGIVPCPPDIMATKFSLSAFRKNRRKLELAEKVETEMIQTKKRREVSENTNVTASLDTVGAVVVDHEGNVAAAVSSGGLAMKHPGRVGQAAVYGCGCWAENTSGPNVYSTAVVVNTLYELCWPGNVQWPYRQKMPIRLYWRLCKRSLFLSFYGVIPLRVCVLGTCQLKMARLRLTFQGFHQELWLDSR